MDYRRENIEDILTELNVDAEKGLSNEQIEENREKYGKNEFEEEAKTSLFMKILHQFQEVMNMILLFAGALSFYISFSDPNHGYAETVVIVVIIIINITVTIYQEGKAEDALESLKEMSSPKATVIRDGKKQETEADEIVQGDILVVESGDRVAADMRLIESNNLQVEESALTGESVPVEKDHTADIEQDAPVGDVLNTAFSGTSVTNGNAKGVVIGIGMDSEMGSIADMLTSNEEQKTPLQMRIDQLAKKLAILAFFAGAIIFALNYFLSDISFLDNLMLTVSLAIAAVPETLPVIVTLSLAYGVQNMAKRNAIIRNMPAVETLGSASVIASDKTGTLTQNKMSIRRIWKIGNEPKETAEEFDEDEAWMLKMMALASDASVEQNDEETVIAGDPTEAAIIRLIEDKGWSKKELEEAYPRIEEFPFDSERKRMTTIHEFEGKYLAISKGAFERIPADTEDSEQDAQKIHDQFGADALRVLAVSYKELDNLPDDSDIAEIEQGMTFSGMVGMIDPPREESKESVQEALKAGIRPIMITGDHAVTATAIADQIGIVGEEGKTITGEELQELSDEELNKHIHEYAVYARVSPEDKIRIVKAWQDKGEVVAMTGDGVNDAPSLQAADVGTAMGESGTEVAKNASDIILTDDNFATIVHAVEEGRRVYENIRKAVYFLLSANIAEIFIMLIATVLGWGTPLIPIHLLFINVIADGIPGFGLSREKAEKDIMKREPTDKDESIFSRGGYRRIAIAAPTFVFITLLAFYLGIFVQMGSIEPSLEVGQTMAFLTLSWSSVLHVFEVRSHESIFKVGITENKTVFWTTFFALALTTLLAALPFLANVFGLAALSFTHWAIAIILSLMIIVVVEIEKFVMRKK